MPPKKSPPKPISLNDEQQAVVNAREGYWKVLAGPGAGKSSCLTVRYVRLIQEGVSPGDVLSLSFTATAAKNLRDRVESHLGKISSNRKVAGSVTFHSMALQFAQEERNEYPFELAEFPLAAENISNKFSGESARKHDLDPRSLRSALQLYRRQRISPAAAVRDAENRLDAKLIKTALAYKDYTRKCKEEGLLDFDDLIFHMVAILDKKPAVRKRWTYDWLQLDEAQDCSLIEWDLARLVSGKSVLAVGDVSQGIYSFRGSDPELFQEMDTMFSGTQTLYLATNYRSTGRIVEFIKPYAASEDLASKFKAHGEEGSEPEVRGFQTAAQECNWAIDRIREELYGD